MTNPVPDGYHSVTPYMIVRDAASAIDFYRRIFGAEEVMRLEMQNGKIGHAEIQIGDSRIMLADEHPDTGFVGPESLGGNGTFLMVYFPNVDEVFEGALEAGCTAHQPLRDQFYGDRTGTVMDPFGHMWTIATHIEDVPPEEFRRRMAAAGF